MQEHLRDVFIQRGILLAAVAVTEVLRFLCEVGNMFDYIARKLVNFLDLDDAQ